MSKNDCYLDCGTDGLDLELMAFSALQKLAKLKQEKLACLMKGTSYECKTCNFNIIKVAFPICKFS